MTESRWLMQLMLLKLFLWLMLISLALDTVSATAFVLTDITITNIARNSDKAVAPLHNTFVHTINSNTHENRLSVSMNSSCQR